jgi:hypothetical protein
MLHFRLWLLAAESHRMYMCLMPCPFPCAACAHAFSVLHCRLRSVKILDNANGVMTIVHEDLIKACTDDDDGTIDQDELDKWRAVLVANGIKTTKHWLTATKATSFDPKAYGDALVGYLDELAGVRSPGAPSIGARRFLLAFKVNTASCPLKCFVVACRIPPSQFSR